MDSYIIFQIAHGLLILILLILLFLVFRIFRFYRVLKKSINLFKPINKKISVKRSRKTISPVSKIGATIFKIYKLSDHVKFKNFFDYDKNLYTIFIKKELNNENNQDSD
ncbi:MAG: hypothetical protein FWG98_01705 [Candidatus Cloacimonetes bacterium]|nr:hypothetical protein [Candidatus Cloacimonadota bacterium]